MNIILIFLLELVMSTLCVSYFKNILRLLLYQDKFALV